MKKIVFAMVAVSLLMMGSAWGAVPIIGFDGLHPGLNATLDNEITPVDYGRWTVNTGDWTYDGSSVTITSPVPYLNSSLRFETTLKGDNTTMTAMPTDLDWGFELTFKHTGDTCNGAIPWFARCTPSNNSYDFRVISLWHISTTSWSVKVGDASGGWVDAVTGLDLSDGAFHKFTTHYKAANQRLDIYVDDVLRATDVALGHNRYDLSRVQLEDSDVVGTDSYGYVKIGQINPAAVQGTVTLNGFTGDNTTVPITIEIREVDNTTALETRTVTLAADGSYSFMTLLNGPHDISAKASQWQFLRQTQKNVNLSPISPVTVNFNLAAGDIDGDGAINSTDLAMLLANMDMMADL